ncbi:MAG: DAK2 domain-containing protein [Defluviitaleaceae bacterium]|nr:DAK2 domain-containing protein [Defluviitaleaceae bacterium]
MGLISIDGNLLVKLIIGGANEVTKNTAALNALNVFPVPDGDTGTNMAHTVQAAAKETVKQSSPKVSDVSKAASNGALRGARGNSGVILSQLFRGFAKGLEGKTTATSTDLAEALAKSSEMAYKAVMKPKEGTMLTIGRAAAEAAFEVAFDEEDIGECLKFVIERADQMLAKTPDMLPVLKQAGVVDSGGMGIVMFLKGAMKALEIQGDIELLEQAPDSVEGTHLGTINVDDIKFAYCTEFLVELTPADKRKPGITQNAEEALREYLPTIGDSVVVIEDEGLVKVHVHTNHPGKALEQSLKFGQLLNIKIDNMKQQHTENFDFSKSTEPPKALGVVVVVAGKGMAELFKGLGADVVIEGGQSMNPSADDISQAIERVNADHVIVLPNNKNIILTAEQAGKFVQGKSVHVVPTLSIPQGVACVVANSDTISLEENLAGMKEAMEAVHSGQITHAVRDTVLDGHEIKQGDFLCIYDGDIALVEKDMQSAATALIDHMLAKGGDLVSIYHGEGATAESAETLAEYISEKYPMAEVEIYDGGQPLYSYVLSVE